MARERIIGILQESVAAVWLSVAALKGISALEHNNEYYKAQGAVEVLQSSNHTLAQQWEYYGNEQYAARNEDIATGAMWLAGAAIFGAIGAANISRGNSVQEPKPIEESTTKGSSLSE